MIREIEVKKADNGQYYFRVWSSNWNILATSETYWNKSDCVSAARIIQKGGGNISDGT